MKKNLPLIILLCTFLSSYSQSKKNIESSKVDNPNVTAGVALTFDDTYVNEWFNTDKQLRKYSWKATFCVSKINTLNSSEIAKLLALQKEGNEIAGHGFNHYDAKKFVAQYGIDAYLNQEIDPMLALMNFYSLNVTSFAYPFGFRNAIIDAALLKKFKIIRATTYGAEAPYQQNCYFNNTRVLYGIGMDTTHPSFSTAYLKKLLNYTRQHHKILILFGHKTVNKKAPANYETEMKTLKLICNFVKQNNMKFYTLSELSKSKSSAFMK